MGEGDHDDPMQEGKSNHGIKFIIRAWSDALRKARNIVHFQKARRGIISGKRIPLQHDVTVADRCGSSIPTGIYLFCINIFLLDVYFLLAVEERGNTGRRTGSRGGGYLLLARSCRLSCYIMFRHIAASSPFPSTAFDVKCEKVLFASLMLPLWRLIPRLLQRSSSLGEIVPFTPLPVSPPVAALSSVMS